MSDNDILDQSLKVIHDKIGDNIEIYGVGFSLGANHLLRYIGDKHYNPGMKAAVSISNPFDVLACCVKLKYKFFSIYDKAILINLSRPFH
jgi:predicted alpha/beta-fold hydrolase